MTGRTGPSPSAGNPSAKSVPIKKVPPGSETMPERVSESTCLGETGISAASDSPGCRSEDGVQQQPFAFCSAALISQALISYFSLTSDAVGGKDFGLPGRLVLGVQPLR